jgi:hypothetical protein
MEKGEKLMRKMFWILIALLVVAFIGLIGLSKIYSGGPKIGVSITDVR